MSACCEPGANASYQDYDQQEFQNEQDYDPEVIQRPCREQRPDPQYNHQDKEYLESIEIKIN